MKRRSPHPLPLLVLSVGTIVGSAGGLPGSEVAIARRFEQEGLQAFAAHQPGAFLDKLAAAVALRPDHPRFLYHLAIAQAANHQPEEAVATLGRLADLGVFLPAADDDDLGPLRGRDDFGAVLARLEANLQPVGAGAVDFALPHMSGLIEGIAWRQATGEFFFGDVHERCVWVRGKDGTVEPFTRPDDDRLLGVFGLVVDETRGRLWAAMSAVPEMRGLADTTSETGVAAIDLATGTIRQVVTRAAVAGQEHVFGDLALAGDGTLYVTDSVAPVIWRLAPDADTFDAWLEHDEFVSLQGIAFTADGRGLLVTAYGNGLLRVDLATKRVHRLVVPPKTTLLGCDGLMRTAGGELVVIQNGVRPARVLRLTLDSSSSVVTDVTTLAAGLPPMFDVTLGCLTEDSVLFIGDGGWGRHGPKAAIPAGPRPVPIVKVKLAP